MNLAALVALQPALNRTTPPKPMAEKVFFGMRFAGEGAVLEAPPQEVKKPRANMISVPDAMASDDLATVIQYFRTRDKDKYNSQDSSGLRVEAAFNKCNVMLQDGVITNPVWVSEKGAPFDDGMKAAVLRLMQRFITTIHEKIEPLPNQLHTLIAVPMEYTFKAGQSVKQALRWHTDSFVKFLGITGVHVDPRITGANLQLRSFDSKDKVETFPTITGRMLAFHNINAEHQVDGVEVENSDPETPALRDILTLAVNKTVYTPTQSL
jgi:hypothetical protein